MRAIQRSLLIALWFMVLTFPLLVIRVNTTEKIIAWRWGNLLYMGLGSFVLALVWPRLMARAAAGRGQRERRRAPEDSAAGERTRRHWRTTPGLMLLFKGLAVTAALVYPLVASIYQVNIMATALIYVGLGLGLNIVVGMAGLLNLGYAAFYAVGAYTYALLNHHYGLGFWTVLPLGGALAALFGILLAMPVLRLRGDYLAIVTLGFGEIVRLVLENWNDFSFGPSGISQIDRPALFGLEFTVAAATTYIYYILLAMIALTVFVSARLQNSRIGRALVALREDEIACQAMGIDKTAVKLTAFALGATWAGLMGVIFAAKTTFVNPASFTFLESAMILSIVVLGGMGSVTGVVIAAFVLQLLPEYLRFLADYRMLLFGLTMVLMMIFRPQGLISTAERRTIYPMMDKLLARGERP
jgi:branched-chain amino acid transport system permease protein